MLISSLSESTNGKTNKASARREDMAMRCLMSFVCFAIAAGLCAEDLAAQAPGTIEVALTVPSGTPLRVVLPDQVRIKRVGEPLRGILAKPVYAFDTVVIPVGAELRGRIARIEAVPARKLIPPTRRSSESSFPRSP